MSLVGAGVALDGPEQVLTGWIKCLSGNACALTRLINSLRYSYFTPSAALVPISLAQDGITSFP